MSERIEKVTVAVGATENVGPAFGRVSAGLNRLEQQSERAWQATNERLRREVMTPAEALAEKVNDLNQRRAVGGIDPQTYERQLQALKAAEDEAQAVRNAAAQKAADAAAKAEADRLQQLRWEAAEERMIERQNAEDAAQEWQRQLRVREQHLGTEMAALQKQADEKKLLAARERDRELAEGQRIANGVKTKTELRDEALSEADRLFGNNAITSEVYKRRISQINRDHDGPDLGAAGALGKVVAGAALVSTFAAATEATSAWVTAVRRGEDAIKATQDALRGNAIASPFIRAGEAINEMATGTQEAIRNIMADVDAANTKMEDRARRAELLRSTGESADDAARNRVNSGLAPEHQDAINRSFGQEKEEKARIADLLRNAGMMTATPTAEHVASESASLRRRLAAMGATPVVPEFHGGAGGAGGAGDSGNWQEVANAQEAKKKFEDEQGRIRARIDFLKKLQDQIVEIRADSAKELPFPFRIKDDPTGPNDLGKYYKKGDPTPTPTFWDEIADRMAADAAKLDADRESRAQVAELAIEGVDRELDRLRAARATSSRAGVEDSTYGTGLRSVGGDAKESTAERELIELRKLYQKQAADNRDFINNDLKPFIQKLPQNVQDLIRALQNPPDLLRRL